MGDQHQVHVWENTYIMAPKARRARVREDWCKRALRSLACCGGWAFTCAAGSEKLPDTDHGRWKDMAPQDDEKMLPSKVTAVIKNVMEGYLQD